MTNDINFPVFVLSVSFLIKKSAFTFNSWIAFAISTFEKLIGAFNFLLMS